MKKTLISSVQAVARDKSLLAVFVALLLVSVLYIIYFSVNITASDIHVGIKYTAFSLERLYRAPWTYLLSFVGFGFVVGVLHTVIMAKLYRIKGRRFAVFFGWCSVGMLIIAWLLLSNILGIAGRN